MATNPTLVLIVMNSFSFHVTHINHLAVNVNQYYVVVRTPGLGLKYLFFDTKCIHLNFKEGHCTNCMSITSHIEVFKRR